MTRTGYVTSLPWRGHTRGKGARRWLSLVLAIALGAVGAVVVSAPASAHYFIGGQLVDNFTIKPYSYNSQWQPPMDRSIQRWNADSDANITKSNGSSSTVTAASYSDTWYGHYQSYVFSFSIRLNARTISRDAGNFQNFVQSVFTHELGHALSLGHNSVTSIMNDSRNRNTLYTPQSHDISDVNSYYI